MHDDLKAAVYHPKHYPRKTFGWKTSTEGIDEHHQSTHQAGVASAGRILTLSEARVKGGFT